jgi:hypothetical protein
MGLKSSKIFTPILILGVFMFWEYFPEKFTNIPFRYKVPDTSGYVFDTTYKDAVWYFILGIVMLTITIITFCLIDKKHVSARFGMLAPISWSIFEFYQKFCWLIKLNDSRIYFDDSSRWQFILVTFFILGMGYGFWRHKS